MGYWVEELRVGEHINPGEIWWALAGYGATEQDAQVKLAKLALEDGGQYRIVKEE